MGTEEKHPGGLAQIVLFIIINSNVIAKPPVTPLTAAPHLRSHSLEQAEGVREDGRRHGGRA